MAFFSMVWLNEIQKIYYLLSRRPNSSSVPSLTITFAWNRTALPLSNVVLQTHTKEVFITNYY